MVYTHNGILCSLHKEGTPRICYNMDETVGQSTNAYNSIHMKYLIVNIIETGSRKMVAKTGAMRRGN